ncbi:hypothetical protein RKD29_000295 [Streptomyces tendae]
MTSPASLPTGRRCQSVNSRGAPDASGAPPGGQLVGKSSAVLIRLFSRAPDSVSTPLLP